MCELIGGLLALGLMLAVFAAFGHAIWLMAVIVIRALRQDTAEDESTPLLLLQCPSCGKHVPPRDGRCPKCSEVIPLPPAELLTELELAHRHLRRLRFAGRLSASAYEETLSALRRELSRAARLANRPAGQSRQAPVAELTGERVAGVAAIGPDLAGASPTLSAAQTFLSESGPRQDAEQGPREVYQLETGAQRSPAAVVPSAVNAPEEILSAEAAVVTPPGRPGSRALADLLRAFMEEKNIRWGELLSGLLIVGSAVGLVVSLWASLRDAIPYFPALIFLLVTAAIHGAGMYTLRRWKLKSTSRALLVISTLLIPLNFLAAIALSEQRPVTDPLYLTAVGTGLFAFGIMAFVAGRVLLLSGAWLLPVAVLGTSAGQLLATRLARPGMSHRELTLLTALPVVSYLIATCGQMVIAARWRHLTQRRAGQVLLLLGVSVFALLMPLGLIVVKSAALWPTLAQLAPWVSLAGFSIVGLGLVLQRRLIAPEVTALRTAATAIVLCGAAAMTISLVLAWPQAELLVLVGVIDCVLLTVLAVAGRFPALHVPAIEALGLALLIGYHLATGSVKAGGADGRELLAVLLMGRSGAVLTAFAVLVMSAAGLLRRAGRNADALAYLTGTGGLAVASTVIALYAGLGSRVDGELATPLLTFWAAVVLTIAYFARRSPITWAGSGLLLAACLHGVNLNPVIIRWLAGLSWHPAYPEVTSVLLHATLAALLALVTRGGRRRETSATSDTVGADAVAGDIRPDATDKHRAGWILPLVYSSACISALAVLPALGARGDTLGVHAAYGFWTAGLWLAYAALLSSPVWLGAFHCLAAFSVMLTVAFVCQRQPWWSNVGDPRHWHAQWAVLALWSAGWIATRRIAPGWRPLCDVWKKAPPVIEQTVLGISVAGFTALCTLGALPGVTAEFAVVSEAAAQPAMLFLLVLTCGLCLGLLVATSAAVAREQWLLTTLTAALLTVALTQPAWGRLAENFWMGAVDNHAQAYGPSAWLAGAGVLLALLAAGWARPSFGVSIGLVCTLLTVPLLISARFETLQASASVLRWGMAGGLIATVLLMQLRDRMSRVLSRTNLPERCPPHMLDTLGMAALVICLPALLALTLRFLVSVAVGITLAEPAAETLFARLGPVLSYAGPLCLLAVTLAGLALRERSALYALAGSLAVNFAVSLTDLLSNWSGGTAFGPEAIARYFQWNAIAFGAYAVAWLAVRSWLFPARVATATAPADNVAENFVVLEQAASAAAENALWTQSWLPVPLQIQVGATVITTALLAAWAAVATIVAPGNLSPAVQTLGTIHSYAAALLAAAALGWSRPARGIPHRDCAVYFGATSAVPLLGFFLSGSASFAAASLGDRNTAENWISYHVLMAGWASVAALAAVWAVVGERPKSPNDSDGTLRVPFRTGTVRSTLNWALALGGAVMLLAWRGLWEDPQRPWWSAGATAAVALLAGGLALGRRSQPFAYASTICAAMAAAFVWTRPWLGIGIEPVPQHIVDLIEAPLLAVLAMSLLWLAAEVWSQLRRGESLDSAIESPPVHHAGAILGLIVGVLLIGGGLVRGAFGSALDRQAVDVSNVASWSIWGLLVLLSLGSLWDRAARHALPALYTCAWLAAALVLDQCEVGPRNLVFGIGLSGGLIVLFSGLLWKGRDAATRSGGRWGWPEPDALLARTAQWLPAVNVIVAVMVVMLEFWVVLTLEKLSLRLWGAAACAMLAAGIAAFAQQERRARFQELALLLAAVAAVDFGWAITEPRAEAQFALQRAIRLLVMLAATTFVYGGLLVRLVSVASGWFQAVRRVACLTGVLSVGTLLAVIGMEATWFDPLHGAPVTPLQIGVVALVLVGLAAALVSLAVLPGRDPLDLSAAGRMHYVYASEGILALLFVHIYLTKPEWFQGYLLAHWPVIVMGLAFFGVGVGELFQRARQVVLAEPLQRTGAFLPLLPALGFWIHTSRAEYSAVLFAVGFLYVLLSMWRGSFVYSVAAALAGNAGLWALWHEQGAALLEHPQLWMIPPALSVLVAAQLNRDRLTVAQLTAVRYLSVTIIYVSSTGEMFITGVGESLWTPVILASLSVLGAFAGIALRVRAFLYLGSSFLMLSIVSMVWHAARNIGHVWPWWAFGIGLGLAILAVFGLFEKKHREMLELLDRLRQWEQ